MNKKSKVEKEVDLALPSETASNNPSVKPSKTRPTSQGDSVPRRSSKLAERKGTNPSDKSASSGGKASKPTTDDLFDMWDSHRPEEEFTEAVRVDSLESGIGYSSLFRQMHSSFVRSVAFYRSPTGGSLSIEEARARAFHACANVEEAKNKFDTLMGLPLESLNFVDFMELQAFAPRLAEQLWEMAKLEGQKEFLSGHLAANITFPVAYMKEVWNIARYLGVRESFIADWEPSGGIEMSLIDMMTQSYFQWQFWLEETVKRSQTREKEVHHEYARWMAQQGREANANGYDDGYWVRPSISEAAALDQAVQMADRWNRIYLRTLRQLRDLRRYAPVTINNAGQVNIASEGGKQVNVNG